MKRNSMYFVLLATLFILVACGTGTESETEETPGSSAGGTTEETKEVETPDSDTKIDEEDKPSGESDSEDPDVEKITETGIYNGQADPHTIEIETDDGPMAFQLTMEARNDIEQLTIDNEVTYTYYEDGEQLVIESINPK